MVCDWTTVVIGNQRPVKTISDLSESSIPSVKIPLVSSFHSVLERQVCEMKEMKSQSTAALRTSWYNGHPDNTDSS